VDLGQAAENSRCHRKELRSAQEAVQTCARGRGTPSAGLGTGELICQESGLKGKEAGALMQTA
jgi:hypothetical protein